MGQSFIRGEGLAGANGVEVIPLCAPENGELHKIAQPFLRGHIFFVPSNFCFTKETTLKKSTTSQIL